jgi:hypothetical protein
MVIGPFVQELRNSKRLSHLKFGGTRSVASDRTILQGDYTSNQKMEKQGYPTPDPRQILASCIKGLIKY